MRRPLRRTNRQIRHPSPLNAPQNEWIWCRSYDSKEVMDAYMASPDRAAYADITGRCIAKTEVRTVDLKLGEISVANKAMATA